MYNQEKSRRNITSKLGIPAFLKHANTHTHTHFLLDIPRQNISEQQCPDATSGRGPWPVVCALFIGLQDSWLATV